MTTERGTWRLPEGQVALLLKHAHLGSERRYRAGQVLYEQGTHALGFYLLLEGMVQVSMITADGLEVILELMGPDTVLGEGAAFPSTPKFSRAQALTDARAIEFVLPDMTSVFREYPEFGAAVFEISSQKLSIMMRRFIRLASRRPEDRILELLERLSHHLGTPHPAGTRIDIHLTHDQVAAMTATSRVTVTRALQRLRKEGRVLEAGRNWILVHDGAATTGTNPTGQALQESPRSGGAYLP